MTKENQGQTKKNNANIILCYLQTGLKLNHKQTKKKKKKETNSINIYDTHLWHKYAAVGLATFLSFFFFFKPNYHGNSAKGEGVGRTRAFHRALAKIHSKKFKFYTKHLTLRVYKKCFLLGSGQYLHKLFTKKVVCSVLLKCVPFFLYFFFHLLS